MYRYPWADSNKPTHSLGIMAAECKYRSSGSRLLDATNISPPQRLCGALQPVSARLLRSIHAAPAAAPACFPDANRLPSLPLLNGRAFR